MAAGVPGQQGLLYRKSGPTIKNWRQMWFRLDGSILTVYPDSTLDRVVDTINVRGRSIEEFAPGKAPHALSFQISGVTDIKGVPAVFAAIEERDYAPWIKSLKNAASARKSKLFGHDLASLKSDSSLYDANAHLPLFVSSAIKFLDREDRLRQEGLFRLCGSQARIDELHELLDQGGCRNFDSTEDPNVVAALLKLYVRMLPEPLLGYGNYEHILASCRENEAALPGLLSSILHALPEENMALLRALSQLMRLVDGFSASNKMNMVNLATVFGPNILRPRVEDPMKLIAENDLVSRATLCLFSEDGIF